MDHAEHAEDLLAGIFTSTKTDQILLALAHAVIGLCQRWDDFPSLTASPVEDDEEDE